MGKETIDQIEKQLPQTQCGQCDYDGCRPYAEAINRGEAPINRCVPGGEVVLSALAAQLQQKVTEIQLKEIQQKEEDPWVAWVNPQQCIGCYKCIDVCPQDAFVGTRKTLTTVIPDDCNGCGLCLPVCPMDCIEKAPTNETAHERLDKKSHYAERYRNHNMRKEHRKKSKQQQYRQAKKPQGDRASQLQARMAEIQAAVQRHKRKHESGKKT